MSLYNHEYHDDLMRWEKSCYLDGHFSERQVFIEIERDEDPIQELKRAAEIRKWADSLNCPAKQA